MIEDIKSLVDLCTEAEKRGITLSALTAGLQARSMKTTIGDIRKKMKTHLETMRISTQNGMKETRSPSGLSGGLASLLLSGEGVLLGKLCQKAAGYALAIAEHNACMGRIVAAPTAGSCGILPGVLLSIGEELNIPDEKLIDGLINSGAVGMVIAQNSSLSGAQGGCAAECGSAGAMAASAAVEILGGSPKQCENAVAIALKAIMGLVCDPVAGLVEVPCVKRNATGATVALTSAEMALAGIKSVINADEVITAMKSVGCMMHEHLRETSLGGIAVSPTAKEIEQNLFK